ncbi:MAG: glycosyl hydrolase family 3 [Chloroflexi bacterium]|uniref:glycoside hydrolase family 3 protein n=1 Tax=Candidatus Flexifilum breve TaxID=3140694 RepID=UPI0031372040|nr:glycosyl hydrolase family 3 [Chloroflexota bacterium]
MTLIPETPEALTAFIAGMTLEEKIGQMFLLAFSGDRLDEARVLMEEYGVGGSYISNDNIPTPEAAAAMTQQLQGFAARTRLGLPLLLGVDQEGVWGVMMSRSCTGPGNLALGAANDAETTYAMYRVLGQELAAVGLNVLFAPAADCNSNPHNSIIGMRSFGERPSLVGRMTTAAVRGAQAGGVIATVKHFPGHGDTRLDSHRGLPTVNRSLVELHELDLRPFREGIAAGAEIVMTAHIIFPALDPDSPATLSARILQDLLRAELGFDGVILSDSMNMRSMKRNYTPADAAIRAFNAGVDMLMLAEEHYEHDAVNYLRQQTDLIQAVITSVREGSLPIARVDDAVARILRLKRKLVSAQQAAQQVLHPELVGSAANVEVELAAARRAVAFLRGGAQFQPLHADQPQVLVNATHARAYVGFDQTRGIGPNQSTPAYEYFAAAFKEQARQVTEYSAEQVLNGTVTIPDGSQVVVVTENYPLPGMDFDQSTQPQVIERLIAQVGADRVIVVGLRDPYELERFAAVRHYLCAFSFRPCAARAAAEALFGRYALVGSSPVSVPETEVHAQT